MKLDILAIGVHPDDVELGCGATLAKEVSLGKKVGILDLTRGELGTRGTPELRLEEADNAAKVLGITIRENLGFEDGFFENNKSNQIDIIRVIRKYQPEVVITNAPDDRHPDHGRASLLSKTACFLAGLRKIETQDKTIHQKPWRPKQIYFYIQWKNLSPDFIVDVSEFIETKMHSVLEYKSQFYDPKSQEPKTPISDKSFLDNIRFRALDMGRLIGKKYGEGFIADRVVATDSLTKLI